MNDPNTQSHKGDILWSNNNLNKSGRPAHYMIFIKPYDSHYFVGAMITHSKGYGNIRMEEKHFKMADDAGKNYKVYYDNSLIVGRPLFKNLEWKPFSKVGELTEDGINFIEKYISENNPGHYYDNLL